MQIDAITDYDAAYENSRHIPDGDGFAARWAAQAQDFRAANPGPIDVCYGPTARSVYDLFAPSGPSRGLFVFVHGGYWIETDKSVWSHLAAGPLAQGWSVLVPSYDLCPGTTIPAIVAQVGAAVSQAAQSVSGPVILTGHSAGGHIAASLACTDTVLSTEIAVRVSHVVSISGIHDLRPITQTAHNTLLGLTPGTAAANSPALKRPLPHLRLTTWVGANERPEFLRQSALLSMMWGGLGIGTSAVKESDRHHFDVIDGLILPDAPLCRAALA